MRRVKNILFKLTLTKKIILQYAIAIIISASFTSLFSYIIFQKLLDSHLSVVNSDANIIRNKLEELYDTKTNILELPNLTKESKGSSKTLFETVEKFFPNYELKIPTFEGTFKYIEKPKLIYDSRQKKYFFEITRVIKFSKNLPFKSMILTIRLNFYIIILKSLFFATILTSIIVIPLIVFLSRRIIKPILKISKGAHEIANGNLGISIDLTSNDEIGDLTRSFNYMSKELHKIKKIRDDLLATISHELRSPLGRIKGYTELLSDFDLKKTEQDQYFQSISREIDLLNELVGEIIEISRLEMNKQIFSKERVDIGKVLDEIKLAANLNATVEKANYHFDYDYDLVYDLDIEKFKRVINNVIQNSLKAGATDIHISGHKNNDTIEIIIIDNGKGIPEEQLEIVFEKFYRLDKSRTRKTGGFGLGLAICKGIIEGHNGKIFFARREGGAELHIEFPLNEDAEEEK